MTNEEAITLVKEFKQTGSSYVFEDLWSSTVMMVNPYKYFDPSGARDEEDFEQVTRIGLYQAFSDEVSKRRGGGPLPLYLKFATSFSSGAIASAIGNPFDVSLVRMQADAMSPAAERRNYKGVVDAVTRIVKEEGFGALYHG